MEDRLVQVIVLVSDLEAARRHMHDLGLTATEGGRHPGRGTANLVVPFGRHYLELLAVVDTDEAGASPQGRVVTDALAVRGPGLARWSVEPADLEATAARVGYRVERRRRVRPDGVTVTWRSVGVDEAWREPWRCSYMAWDDPALHPARAVVTHACGATGFSRLEVEAPDAAAARAWMGGTVPPGVSLTAGAGAGPVRLLLASPQGEMPID